MLCDHDLCLVPKHSSPPKEASRAHYALPPGSLFPPAPGNHQSVFWWIALFGTFHVNRIIHCDLPSLCLLTQPAVPRVHLATP